MELLCSSQLQCTRFRLGISSAERTCAGPGSDDFHMFNDAATAVHLDFVLPNCRKVP